MHILLNFEPIELILPQDIYTCILRILDLNINYTDGLTESYFFYNNIEIEDFLRLI